MSAKKRSTKRIWRDPDDAPELTNTILDRAEIAVGGKIVRPARGTLTKGPGRPKSAAPKKSVHLRLSPDVLEHFRAAGRGWQTRIDEALRRAAKLGTRKDL